ncbi:MAG: hypothetical protein KBS91_01495, partial [Firmicutes bacterium]|nr:hypothetical protein [Candidatus Caballimonas caccae]
LMHSVNNGPCGSRVRQTGNFPAYNELKIPYARLHDSSFCSNYGGEWTVDVHRIFCDFSADENDEKSYDFSETDVYLQDIKSVGTEIFYRLGASIEHRKKYGTYPPKDFLKWAKICEHIIRHYNDGWANGFNFNIKYWEIWNEPDSKNSDGSNPCWQGTNEQFFEFFEVASKYLKAKFPTLIIGGPAVCFYGSGFAQNFLPYAKEHNIPLDFFSFHCYGFTVEFMKETIENFKRLLKENGYGDSEMILNEWNYIRGWLSDEYSYSLKTIRGLKGSSFMLGTMCMGQASELDMLMYYDARPCAFNGIFGLSGKEKYKSYYTAKAFSHLYELGGYVKEKGEIPNIYACAAMNEEEKAILVTYFDEKEEKPEKSIKLNIKNACKNICKRDPIKLEYFVVDENNDLTLQREEIFTSDCISVIINLKLFESCLIKIKSYNE